ncbi:MAG: peptidoglycan-binding domain-containing protein [Candidatus Pacebacteria bacterium]|nr:peptidoglycan-binding domain-containing protein [Candidatus Paceibacterota bacterium]
MVKYFSGKYKIAVLAVVGLLAAVSVSAANYNEVQFTSDTTIYLSGLGINITVLEGSNVGSFAVGTSSITVALVGDSNGYSNITFKSSDKYEMDSSDGSKATCGTNETTLTFTIGDIKTKTVVVYPRTATCLTAASVVTLLGGGGGSSNSQTQQQQQSQEQTQVGDALRAKIAELLAQIASLQAQLGITTGGSQATVAPFGADLVYGLKKNSEAKRLQEFLISKGYLKAGLNTGNFLSQTMAAVKAYQKAKGIRQTGNAGPLTRAAINADLGIK